MPDTHKRLREVITFVITLIPDNLPNRTDLITEITHQRDGLTFKAPELAGHEWGRFCGTLAVYIGDPAGRPWAQRISRLVRDEEKVPTI